MKKLYKYSVLTIFSLLCLPALINAAPKTTNEGPALYSDTLHAVHYGIYLTDINVTQKTIKGYTIARLTPKLDNLAEIKLELATLTVDSIFVGNIKNTNWTYTGNRIVISLVSTISIGDTIETTVYYHGGTFVDPSGWGGFHFAGEFAFNLGVGFDAIPHNLGKAWFPCIDDFQDRALYDCFITMPNDKKAICGGKLINVQDNGNGTATWHWKHDYTLPTYLVSVSTGKYFLKEDSFSGVNGVVPITFYCRATDTAKVAGTFANLKNILQIYETHFGPYPFERVGYTATANGAMEHAGNISYPYSGWNGTTGDDWWYAHELSHMWFGDMVTCASAGDMWLNEGWARWCESLMMEGLYGKNAATDYLRDKHRDVLQSTYLTDGGYFALYNIPENLTYGSTVYDKGGMVTHTLRNYLGDSLFFNGIKAYLQQYAYNDASSYDLRDFLSNYTGQDLDEFFNTWVFGPGFPQFGIDSVNIHPAGNQFLVNVYVKQKQRGTDHISNENRLEITFAGSNWQMKTDSIHFSGITGHKTFLLDFPPVAVMVDYFEKIADATTDYLTVVKNMGTIDFPETLAALIVDQISDSALVRITHNWVAPDSLQHPITGFRISDTRYWTVEGIFPEGLYCKGKFSYSRNISLDKNLIRSSGDSIILLYRPDARFEWKGVKTVKTGNWVGGTLTTVDSLLPGQYTLGVYDEDYNSSGKLEPAPGLMEVYPNPAQNFCNIYTKIRENGVLNIYSLTGSLIDSIPVKSGNNLIHWVNNTTSVQTFLFQLNNMDGRALADAKVIFTR